MGLGRHTWPLHNESSVSLGSRDGLAERCPLIASPTVHAGRRDGYRSLVRGESDEVVRQKGKRRPCALVGAFLIRHKVISPCCSMNRKQTLSQPPSGSTTPAFTTPPPRRQPSRPPRRP
ncbi:hypothetical protein PMIN05_004375 [Paraphaeosphaeria minitans]